MFSTTAVDFVELFCCCDKEWKKKEKKRKKEKKKIVEGGSLYTLLLFQTLTLIQLFAFSFTAICVYACVYLLNHLHSFLSNNYFPLSNECEGIFIENLHLLKNLSFSTHFHIYFFWPMWHITYTHIYDKMWELHKVK